MGYYQSGRKEELMREIFRRNPFISWDAANARADQMLKERADEERRLREEERKRAREKANRRNRLMREIALALGKLETEIIRKRQSGELDEQEREQARKYELEEAINGIIPPETRGHERYILSIEGGEELRKQLYGGLDEEELYKFMMLGRLYPEWRFWKGKRYDTMWRLNI